MFSFFRERRKRRLKRESILGTYSWIRVPKYKDDPSKSWEERYKALHEHHVLETEFLIEKIREYEYNGNQ